ALPQVQGSANYTKLDQTQSFNQTVFGQTVVAQRDFNLDSRGAQIVGEQPIFTGLRNFNAIRAAKARVKAGDAQLAFVEQDVLQRAAQSYFDVVRDMEVYEATKNNVDVLLRQKREAELRFEVGEVTKTDVAQADARLAQSRAQLTTSQARLAVSRASFAEIIGQTPETLETDPALPPAPASLADAQAIASQGSPALVRARMAEEASRRNVAVAKGAFSPTVSLTASYQYSEEPNSFINNDEQFAYGVRATVPIFLGGLNISRVREANALHDADRRRIEEAERRATAAVTAAWEQLAAARANIVSATSQVEANLLALTGVRREAQLGTRTTLDVLDAEQEYLNAQVSLANAERDARSATFQLLAAMGVLGPDAGDGTGEAVNRE
ncbi:MAG: hypothetical protein A3E78_04095, partial [Alphaproteobacteria bacterium RIFCSPHIGHO2_12_FULL_63_12]